MRVLSAKRSSTNAKRFSVDSVSLQAAGSNGPLDDFSRAAALAAKRAATCERDSTIIIHCTCKFWFLRNIYDPTNIQLGGCGSKKYIYEAGS